MLVAGFVHLAGSAEAMAVLLCKATAEGAAAELVAVAIAAADGAEYPEKGELTPVREATEEELGVVRSVTSQSALDDLDIEALVSSATYVSTQKHPPSQLDANFMITLLHII